MVRRQRVTAVMVVIAVGLAFADASVVALALVDLYAEFDTTIVGVSWVLTSYALAVAVAAVPLAAVESRVRPLVLLAWGAGLFAVASLVAGAATGLAMLLTARCLQGVGATLLLANALPVLGDLVGHRRSRRWWAGAGALGTTAGPAIGGILTQAFDWRAIFYFQAPIGAAVVVAAIAAGRTPPLVEPERLEPPVMQGRRRLRYLAAIANVGFALLFAALVAALFLGVLLAIEVWRYSPLHGALLVSALPVGMCAARALAPLTMAWRAGGGAALLSCGLLGLAFVPGERPIIAALAFVLCGAGFDLLHDVLDRAAVQQIGPTARAGATSVGARHAGLVLGLLLIAPVLSSSVMAGIDRARLAATGSLLESDLGLSDKVSVTWALRSAIDDARPGEVPDLAREFDDRGAEGDNELALARDDLTDAVGDAMTRAFRPAFAIAAGLAASSAVPALLVAFAAGGANELRLRARRRRAIAGAFALGALGGGVIAATVVGGARHVGEYSAADPCTAGADPHPGRGLDAAAQRIALSALNGAACELGTSREVLVLSLDPDSGRDDVAWDRETAERALGVGARRAVDDAQARGDISEFAAGLMRVALDRTPIIELLTEGLPSLS